EREICFDPRFVGPVHARHFAEVAFAFGILGREQVAPGSLGTQNFAGASDFKPFRDRFACFAARN
ncbi:MAG: hypothetical protein QOI96_287, partial [Verrucomicrobiota bacterium]